MKRFLVMATFFVTSITFAHANKPKILSQSKKQSLKKELMLKQIKMIKSSQSLFNKKPKQV